MQLQAEQPQAAHPQATQPQAAQQHTARHVACVSYTYRLGSSRIVHDEWLGHYILVNQIDKWFYRYNYCSVRGENVDGALEHLRIRTTLIYLM